MMHSQSASKRPETLDYIQSMLGELRNMAKAEHCDMLVYLIEMAYVEASDAVRDALSSRAVQKRNSSA